MFFPQRVDAVDDGVCREDALFIDLQGEVIAVESVLIAMTYHRNDIRQIVRHFLARREDSSHDFVVGKSFVPWEDDIVAGEFVQLFMTCFPHQLLNERVFQHCRHIFISPGS